MDEFINHEPDMGAMNFPKDSIKLLPVRVEVLLASKSGGDNTSPSRTTQSTAKRNILLQVYHTRFLHFSCRIACTMKINEDNLEFQRSRQQQPGLDRKSSRAALSP